MDYRSKILEFMQNNVESNADFIVWVKTFPEMQQVELMRELNRMTEEKANEIGLNMKEYIPNYEKADETLNTFEDAILNKRILKDYIKSLNVEQEKLKTKMIHDIEESKIYVISSILNNAPNALEMKRIAKQMIAVEKKFGVYNSETWEGIE
ncbi:hypothetical protein A7A78_00775 [Aequorivita soesokkakensis]|uniref:Uncharacterized protein n=2 Tax=Aequorivita soesokkakensis TaxID=1385699 RepID=A0A1A9LHB7_9FLAO|nr:hypothetical protein A7A78_00775 [Aequorivita soesokkakensis]